ncbi:FHA domain-containing protein [Luteimicrobium subarcticum]|uniref:FHA domain-containing protein n=1 Tax=Luteimicrobium subarcticum TaxID=620910 RepID=A0A2M8WVN1_9MICO|nr:FHA domain-containing protein [Luteimicrobium subarcticum]PJI94984.1 FHA domain-containing protein [Luteimicrobium subarcticum]
MTDVVTRELSRYATGSGWAVVRGSLLVVLPSATADQATATWAATDDAHGVMEVLQAVGEAFGTSLAALPPFAVVVRTGRRAHVLVRGDVEVTLATEDGTVVLHGRDVTTWVERSAEPVDGVQVRVGGGAAGGRSDVSAGLPGLPLLGGVVRASVVEHGDLTSRASAADPSSAPASSPVVLAKDVPVHEEPTSGAGTEPVDAGPAHAGTAHAAGTSDGSADDQLTGRPDDRSVDRPDDSADDSAEGSVDDVVDASPGELPLGETIAPEHTIAPDGDTPDAAVAPAGPDDDAAASAGQSDDYAALWGSTILRSVEDAAVRAEDEDEDEHGGAGDAGADDGRAPASPTAPDAGLISVPQDWTVPPVVPAPPAPSPEQPAPVATGTPWPAQPVAAAAAPDGLDHDGQTVLSSSLGELHDVAAAAAAQGGAGLPVPAEPAVTAGPMIVARLCAAGHANPPSRGRCAWCGAAVGGEARPVPRPPLGRVRVSTGQVLELDAPLVVGRRPRSPRGPGAAGTADLHRIVTVPSPEQDVSRSHVEVRIEGWHVLVVDLSTTNGTMLRRVGQEPLRIHPNEPVLVVSGDLVDLGDGATLVFEDLP